MDPRRYTERIILGLVWEGYQKRYKRCRCHQISRCWLRTEEVPGWLEMCVFLFLFCSTASGAAGLLAQCSPAPPLLPLFEQLANSSLHFLHLQRQDSFVLPKVQGHMSSSLSGPRNFFQIEVTSSVPILPQVSENGFWWEKNRNGRSLRNEKGKTRRKKASKTGREV